MAGLTLVVAGGTVGFASGLIDGRLFGPAFFLGLGSLVVGWWLDRRSCNHPEGHPKQ